MIDIDVIRKSIISLGLYEFHKQPEVRNDLKCTQFWGEYYLKPTTVCSFENIICTVIYKSDYKHMCFFIDPYYNSKGNTWSYSDFCHFYEQLIFYLERR